MPGRWLPLLLAMGCAKALPEADADLNTVLFELFASYDDPVARRDNAALLDTWMRENGDDELYWDGVLMDNLGEAEAGALIDYPVDFSAHRGVATVYTSRYPANDHAQLAARADQTWTDANAFDKYERDVIEGDPAVFPDAESSLLTTNDIVRSGAFGISIPYILRKDYHWAPVGKGEALMSRWYLETPGCSDNEKNCVLQSWGIEIYAPRSGGAQRLIVNWIETKTQADSLLSEDAMIQLIADGNQDLMEATDEYLDENR